MAVMDQTLLAALQRVSAAHSPAEALEAAPAALTALAALARRNVPSAPQHTATHSPATDSSQEDAAESSPFAPKATDSTATATAEPASGASASVPASASKPALSVPSAAARRQQREAEMVRRRLAAAAAKEEHVIATALAALATALAARPAPPAALVSQCAVLASAPAGLAGPIAEHLLPGLLPRLLTAAVGEDQAEGAETSKTATEAPVAAVSPGEQEKPRRVVAFADTDATLSLPLATVCVSW